MVDIQRYTSDELDLFKKMSVVIVSPMVLHDGIPDFIKSTVNMVAFSWQNGLKVYEFGYTYRQVVDWARNELADAIKEYVNPVTEEKFSHVLWLDSDHIFNPDLCCQLARHMLNPDIDAISALYFARSGKPLPVAYVKDFSDDEHKHFPLVWPPPTLCEVDAIGFGALLMKRDVFDRVPKPWFTLDYRSGEDIAFCVQAKKHGVRFFLDGAYTLGHIGECQIVTRAIYEQHLVDHADDYKDKIQVTLQGKIVKQEEKHGNIVG
jgi:hypothetical protein